MGMTKSEIIDILSRKQSHLSSRDVELSVKILLEQMSDTLADGRRIVDLVVFHYTIERHVVVETLKQV